MRTAPIFAESREWLIKSVRGECFPFAPSIHRASAALGTNGKFIEPSLTDLISPSLDSPGDVLGIECHFSDLTIDVGDLGQLKFAVGMIGVAV